jgi:hypothetical protein
MRYESPSIKSTSLAIVVVRGSSGTSKPGSCAYDGSGTGSANYSAGAYEVDE